MKKEVGKIEEFNLFKCSCGNDAEVPFDEFKKHIAEVHSLTTKEDLSGKKKMITHLDGDRYFTSTYEWTLDNGLVFHQYTQNARKKDDLMYY